MLLLFIQICKNDYAGLFSLFVGKDAAHLLEQTGDDLDDLLQEIDEGLDVGILAIDHDIVALRFFFQHVVSPPDKNCKKRGLFLFLLIQTVDGLLERIKNLLHVLSDFGKEFTKLLDGRGNIHSVHLRLIDLLKKNVVLF